MYKFFDEKGRIIVLRPDMTIPLARVIGTQRWDTPLKVTYSGNVFRANESHSENIMKSYKVVLKLSGLIM